MTTMSQSLFARHIGVASSYVTELKHSGRLVMDGDLVDVEASIALIESTRTLPPKATARGAAAKGQPQTDGGAELEAGSVGGSYQRAKAVKEKYNALMAKAAYEREMGALLPVDDVVRVVTEGDVMVRNALESLPDMLAPLLAAETDEHRVNAIMTEHIEAVLEGLAERFHKLTRHKNEHT